MVRGGEGGAGGHLCEFFFFLFGFSVFFLLPLFALFPLFPFSSSPLIIDPTRPRTTRAQSPGVWNLRVSGKAV